MLIIQIERIPLNSFKSDGKKTISVELEINFWKLNHSLEVGKSLEFI